MRVFKVLVKEINIKKMLMSIFDFMTIFSMMHPLNT